MIITISGASDNLVHTSSDAFNEEFYAYDGAILNVGGKLRVHVIYDGTWSFAVSMIEEGFLLPYWHITTVNSNMNDYTTALRIDTHGEDVRVFLEDKGNP